MINQRFDEVKHSDKIFVLDKGRIVEQGTHDELMKIKKRYYTIYKYYN